MPFSTAGVTFIELVVVISIFSIIAGTLVLNFSRFGLSVSLQNLAQDIALQINDAQKEAIAGRTNNLMADCDRTQSNCAPRYGVYFEIDGTNPSKIDQPRTDGKTIVRFFDYGIQSIDLASAENGIYDTGGNACGTGALTECIDRLTLGQGNYISGICVGDGAGANSLTCNTAVTGINISFKRPFPDAIIQNNDGTVLPYNVARITISSPNGEIPSKDIVITKLGRIHIEQTP